MMRQMTEKERAELVSALDLIRRRPKDCYEHRMWIGKAWEALSAQPEAGATEKLCRDRVLLLEEALREIAKGIGPFSRDPLVHAIDTIASMKAIAQDALKPPPGAGIK